MRVLCLYFHEDVDLQGLGEIFYRYTPQIAFYKKRGLLLEVEQCKSLFGEQSLLLRAQVHLQALGLKANLALGSDPGSALSFAAYPSFGRKSDLPLETLSFFYAPFLQSDLKKEGAEDFALRKIQDMIVCLKKLGISTLGQLSEKISTREMAQRFGALGTFLLNSLHQGEGRPWPFFKPRAVFLEEYEFDPEFPVESLEPILFHLKVMIEKVYWRLRGVGQRVKVLEVFIQKEFGSPDVITVRLANGVLTPKAIFQITKEALYHQVQRTKPVRTYSEQRVSAFKITVQETTPYRESQRDLFQPKKQEEEEELDLLLSRLKNRLGKEAVFKPSLRQSFIPEWNWNKEEKANAVNKDAIPERPLRVLKEPVAAQIFDQSIYFMNQKVFVPDLYDQEVILSEWWNGVPERVYFRGCMQSGADLWMFRTAEAIFVHGYFD